MKLEQPLADALRPTDISDFIGQSHLNTQLKNLSESARLPSLLFYGPPGCGKSTLALLLAKARGKSFTRISAQEVGLTEIRKTIESIDILIIDEIHRFSRTQQDFFLPLLESGKLTMIATTTENPSFCIGRQLLSRMHILRFQPLTNRDLSQLAKRALKLTGNTLEQDAIDLLAISSAGDGRILLNLIEYTSSMTEDQKSAAELKKSLPEIILKHDKAGDSHYELASALIKSIRGSDADAALYYLACLIEGGEDPRFICRRLILSASEDVGLADPQALPLAVACQQAVEFVGMPEGFIPMAETVVYLSLARKSNSTYAAYINAAREIKRDGRKPVPLHLRNAVTGLQKAQGYGKEYKYPHDYPESWVKQTYLPDGMDNVRFYKARTNGQEPKIADWQRRLHNFND